MHEDFGQAPVIYDIFSSIFSINPLVVLHAICLRRECMGHITYLDSHQSCIRLQIGAAICAVLTVDAVATGEVNYYNCIVRLRPLPIFSDQKKA